MSRSRRVRMPASVSIWPDSRPGPPSTQPSTGGRTSGSSLTRRRLLASCSASHGGCPSAGPSSELPLALPDIPRAPVAADRRVGLDRWRRRGQQHHDEAIVLGGPSLALGRAHAAGSGPDAPTESLVEPHLARAERAELEASP